MFDRPAQATQDLGADAQRGRIQAAWERKEVEFITSPVIIAKTDEVLHRPSITRILSTVFSEEQREGHIQQFLSALRRRTHITPHLLDLRVIKADPEDDTILIAAVEGKADCIISGDAHLKNLGTYQDIPILTPAEFVTCTHHYSINRTVSVQVLISVQ